MNTFWQDLKRPIKILAPMENVTDTVFRQIIARTGAPDVFFTEFTAADGIVSDGFNNIARAHLTFTKNETPLIAQLWGKNPENYYKAAMLVKNMGFAGIDINMGCPDKVIVKNGSCGALIKNPELAKKIFLAVKSAVGEDLPVSIKTRLGFSSIQTKDWISFLLDLKPDALTIHLRTVKDLADEMKFTLVGCDLTQAEMERYMDEIGELDSLHYVYSYERERHMIKQMRRYRSASRKPVVTILGTEHADRIHRNRHLNRGSHGYIFIDQLT